MICSCSKAHSRRWLPFKCSEALNIFERLVPIVISAICLENIPNSKLFLPSPLRQVNTGFLKRNHDLIYLMFSKSSYQAKIKHRPWKETFNFRKKNPTSIFCMSPYSLAAFYPQTWLISQNCWNLCIFGVMVYPWLLNFQILNISQFSNEKRNWLF